MKKNIFIIYALFLCLVYLFLNTPMVSAGQSNPEDHGSRKKHKSDYVSVIYFHGDFRCSSCVKIEQYSSEAIEKFFPEELKNGELRFSTIHQVSDCCHV